MKEIRLRYEMNDRIHVVAYVDGCDKLLEQEQILDYFKLLDLRDYLETLNNPDDIVQIKDMIQRIEKRIGLR